MGIPNMDSFKFEKDSPLNIARTDAARQTLFSTSRMSHLQTSFTPIQPVNPTSERAGRDREESKDFQSADVSRTVSQVKSERSGVWTPVKRPRFDTNVSPILMPYMNATIHNDHSFLNSSE